MGIYDDIIKGLESRQNNTPSVDQSSIGIYDDLIKNIEAKGNTLLKPPENPVVTDAMQAGARRGIEEIGETIDPYIAPIVGMKPKFTEAEKANRLRAYQEQYGNSPGAELGKFGAQLFATAPLVPTGPIAAAFESAPVAAALGKGAINRLGSHMATGGAAGTTYGALTGQDVGENATAGAVGGPLLAGAGKLGRMIIPGVRSLMADTRVINAARQIPEFNGNEKALRNVVSILENEGLTADQAIDELRRIGPSATMGDLGPSIATEVGGLAALGGKPTSIVKNRYMARAEGATNAARDLIDSRLGSKPDLENERQAIVKRAQDLTRDDYKTGKTGKTVDLSGVAAAINSELTDNVGSVAKALQQVKGYLYDEKGNLRNSATAAHNIRMALDDELETGSKPLTSAGGNTLRALQNARTLVDTELKKIPEFAAADEKFKKHIAPAKGLQIGYDALTKKTNKEEFTKLFNAASPETQEAIRIGLRSAIGDVMEGSTSGEEAKMRSLFNKKEVNREIMRTAFGPIGDSVNEAVANEVGQRGLERGVLNRSHTAEGQAVRAKYRGEKEPNYGDLALGAAIDASSGGIGATTAMGIKRGFTNRLIAHSEGKQAAFEEGTADLLSRSGASRDAAMNVIKQVETINNRLKAPTFAEDFLSRKKKPLLPTLAVPIGNPLLNYVEGQAKEKLGYGK